MVSNPYEPPGASLEHVERDRCWNETGSVLYVAHGSELPRRCVKCNLPVTGLVKKRTFYWHSPWWYVLVLVNILVYAIVGLIVRRKIKLSPALCTAHRQRRRTLLSATLAAACVAAAAGVSTFGGETADTSLLAFIVAFLCLVAALFAGRIVYPIEINERGARLKGCGDAFLRSLSRQYPE